MFTSFKMNFGAVGAAVCLALFGWMMFAPPPPDPNADVRAQVITLTKAVNELKMPAVVKEKVLDLPEDGERWYTVAVYRDKKLTDASDRHLAAVLASTPRLLSLQAQTRVWVVDKSDPVYAAQYAKFLGGQTPAVVIQSASGKLCYKASGANLPADGEALADEIAASIESCRPFRPKPKPDETPKPNPPANPEGVIPDIRPAQPTQEESKPWGLLAFLLPILSGLGGAGLAWKKSLA